MPENFPIRDCLLVSRDATVTSTVEAGFDELAVLGATCQDAETAVRLLRTHRFRAVVLDWDIEGAQEIFGLARQYCVRKHAICVVLIPQGQRIRHGFEMGATLVLHKPLEAETIRKMLRTARSLSSVHRRRTRRLSLEPVLHIRFADASFKGKILDISESGIAAATDHGIAVGSLLELRLLLPGARKFIETTGKVVRVTEDRIGIRFMGFAGPQHEKHLAAWLEHFQNFHSAREEKNQPATVPPVHNRRPVAERRPGWRKIFTI